MFGFEGIMQDVIIFENDKFTLFTINVDKVFCLRSYIFMDNK